VRLTKFCGKILKIHYKQSGYHSDLRKYAQWTVIRTGNEITIRILLKKKIADFAGMILLIRMMKRFLLWKTVKVDKIWKQNQVISVG
jgi:hypothetical protein